MTLKSLIAEICTPDEAAETLGVTSRRVVALINAGQLPAEQFGGTWAILRSDRVRSVARLDRWKSTEIIKPYYRTDTEHPHARKNRGSRTVDCGLFSRVFIPQSETRI